MLEVSLPALEAISSVALTAMSTVVAVVALAMSHRQSAGLRPVLLVSGVSLGQKADDPGFQMSLTVEVWNRRKYPVVVRRLYGKAVGAPLLNMGSKDGLVVHNNHLNFELDRVVEPGGHTRITLDPKTGPTNIGSMRACFDIRVAYFDPYSNKSRSAKLVHRFLYPRFGWRRTNGALLFVTRAWRRLLGKAGASAAD